MNSVEMTRTDKACLQEISLNLRIADNYYLVVDVHRESSEKDEVSIGRVKKARDYLVNQERIAPNRLIIRDYKDTCPREIEDEDFNGRLEFWYWREKEKIESIPKECASGAKPKYRIIE
jgi:hypothetical protein